MSSSTQPSAPFLIYVCVATALAAYFAYAAVRGDLGVIERLVINAEKRTLDVEKEQLQTRLDDMINKTRRMSDDYLDLDLLDEQARSVLGMMRADELVLRETDISR